MRRRKVTPEVVIKCLGVFMFGGLIGFGAYHLTGVVINRTAFADEPSTTFPKTIEIVDEYKAFINKFDKVSRPQESEIKNSYK